MSSAKYSKFITDVSADIAKRGLRITERLESGDSFDEIIPEMYVLRDLIMEYETLYFQQYTLVDPNGETVTYHDVPCLSGNKFDQNIERIYRQYCISDFPGTLFPIDPITVTLDCGCGIPPGGNPGDYLTRTPDGSLVWKPLPDCNLVRQEFVYTGGLQEFLLPYVSKSVSQLYVNGVLQKRASYDFTSNTVTIVAPNVLSSGDRVIIFASACELRIAEPGNTYYKEHFVWNGDPIVLEFVPTQKHQVFINGQFIDDQDYTFTGTLVTFSTNVNLVDGDEITIFYPIFRSTINEEIGDAIVIIQNLRDETQEFRDEAEVFSNNASIDADRAEDAADAAALSESNALSSEQNAELFSQNAQGFADNAANSSDLAEKWASEDEDVVVANGEFSSKHYSLKSAQSASDSQDSADDSANSAAAALQSEQNAALSEAAALLSEQNALASEQAAQGFAQDASDTLDLIAPAVSQGIDDINDAKDAALIDITSAESSVLGNITQAESDALSDISDAKDQAVQDVADATQDAVDAANTSTQQAILSAAARDDAEAAKLAAEGFADAAEGFKDDAESASVLSTDQAILSAAARDAAEGYKNTANAERLLAEDARDASEGFRDEAEGFKDESEDAKDEAELFANIATQAIGALSSTGTLMQFNRDRIYGFPTAESGNITVDNTTATQGVVVLMRHNDVAEPSYPANFVTVAGNYVDATDNLLNVICVYVDTANTANNIYYLNIINL
jgi:hypothetical protein